MDSYQVRARAKQHRVWDAMSMSPRVNADIVESAEVRQDDGRNRGMERVSPPQAWITFPSGSNATTGGAVVQQSDWTGSLPHELSRVVCDGVEPAFVA